MELLIALLLGGGLVAAGAYAWRSRARAGAAGERPSRPRLPAVEERGLDALRPDDVLSHEGRDWIVAGVATLSEGTRRWSECRLEDGDRVGWLVVTGDDPDHVTLGRAIDDPGVGQHPSESIEHDGQVYRLGRHGDALLEAVGDLREVYADPDDESPVRHWSYERPGAPRAWIRAHGARWGYFVGRRVARHLVGFLPGS